MPPISQVTMGVMSSYGRGLSLLTGWLPVAIQVVAVLVMLAVVVRRAPRRWYLLWLPAAAVTGAVVALLVRGRVAAQGLTDDPAPLALWIWLAVATAPRWSRSSAGQAGRGGGAPSRYLRCR